jgi:DNA-binding response OmpR family regulator
MARFFVMLPNTVLCATLTSLQTPLELLAGGGNPPGECPVQESNKILIVDDRSDIRTFLREFMHLEGFEAIEAIDGDQAIELSRQEKPAVILMDIMMPGRGGLSAVQEIRAEDDKVGIIVMTAYGTEQRAVRAMQMGADDYMHKPFDMEELQTKTRAVLHKNWLRIEN